MKEAFEKLNIMNPGSTVAAIGAELAAVPITVTLLSNANNAHNEALIHIADLEQNQYALARTSFILSKSDDPLKGIVIDAVKGQLHQTKKEIQVSRTNTPSQIPIAEQEGILTGAMALAAFTGAVLVGQIQRKLHNRPETRASEA